MEETFTYDNMNRLTGITLTRPSGSDLHCDVTYDALGRMTSRQAVTAENGVPQVTSVFSQPAFDPTKVHAFASATTTEGMFPATPQTVTYTGFDKVGMVKQGSDSLCYTYGYDRQRIFMEEHLGPNVRTKQYWGACEYVTESDGTTSASSCRTFITGPFGVFAVMMTKGANSEIFYILKDNLGSWTTITDGKGLVEQQLSYDAWGNLRNPNTWANYTASDTYDGPMFDRGYTGHEHLTSFGLINMNGRMYDPVMSSFLSADRFVQNPLTAQGFNRYSYCMNNPLRYVDPSGWEPRPGSGNGDGPYLPGAPYYVDGMLTVDLPEIIIMPDNPSLSNRKETVTYNTYYYGGERLNLSWSSNSEGQSVGSNGGGCGGGSGKSGNNSPIRYMLSNYTQRYHHYIQTGLKNCKIAAARSYYQYFSGIDKGEIYFSAIANGMILVDGNTYLREFYEECGLIVTDGMSVDIIETGQELELGHPYSIILKGEHVSGTTNLDHVVTLIGIQKKGGKPLLIYINDPMYTGVQVYQWVDFRENIKDAYFIKGLKNP